jgi:hypothetical protein
MSSLVMQHRKVLGACSMVDVSDLYDGSADQLFQLTLPSHAQKRQFILIFVTRRSAMLTCAEGLRE